MNSNTALGAIAALVIGLAANPAAAQNTAGGTSSAAPAGSAATRGGGGADAGAFEASLISNVYTADLSDPSRAFYGLDLPQHQLYTGIIPGVRDSLPHIYPHQMRGNRGPSNRLTWIGFQKTPDQPSRVFLQTFRVPAFRIELGGKPNEIVVVLVNTRPASYNFLRTMDARWFPRSVRDIRARRFGQDIHVYITTKMNVDYSVSISGNYLNIDFDDANLEREWIERATETVYDDPDRGNVLRELDR
jgi:hypothetical protein